jgi:hypothetical protein
VPCPPFFQIINKHPRPPVRHRAIIKQITAMLAQVVAPASPIVVAHHLALTPARRRSRMDATGAHAGNQQCAARHASRLFIGTQRQPSDGSTNSA